MTPKIIFDKEPYVIALYRLFEDPTINRTEIDDLFGKLQTLCAPGKVLIPHSTQELKQILRNLSRKIFEIMVDKQLIVCYNLLDILALYARYRA